MLIDDPEEVSWALDIAHDLAKNGEPEGALVWLRRAAQSAAIADVPDRAVELADAAKALATSIRASKKKDAGKRRQSTRVRRVSAPPEVRNPLRPKSLTPPAASGAKKTATPAKPIAVTKTAAKVAAKPLVTKKTVTLAKPKSIVPPAKSKSIAPAAAKPKSTPPAKSKSIAPAAAKKSVPPAVKRKSTPPAAETPRRSIGPAPRKPTPRSMRPPQRTLLFQDTLPEANDPDDALIADAIRGVAALATLNKGKRLTLATSAEVLRPGVGEEEPVNGLMIVAHGSVDVLAAVSDLPGAVVTRGELIRGQTSLDVPLSLRCIPQESGVVLLRWGVAELAEVLFDSKSTDAILREASDHVHAGCGAALGSFAEAVGEDALRELLTVMKLKRLEPGEVWGRAGNRMPGVCVVGLGELRAGDLRDYGPGDVPFAETALANDVLSVPLIAGSKGALLWVGSNASLFPLFTTHPHVLEALSQG